MFGHICTNIFINFLLGNLFIYLLVICLFVDACYQKLRSATIDNTAKSVIIKIITFLDLISIRTLYHYIFNYLQQT